MTEPSKSQHAHFLSDVLAALPEQTGALADFAEAFFTHLSVLEMERLTPNHAAELMETAYRHFQRVASPKPIIAIESTPQGGLRIILVNDDRPFLVDSVLAELRRLGLSVYSVLHPIFHITRHADGTLNTFSPYRAGSKGERESLICLECSTLPPGLAQADLAAALRMVLGAVQLTQEDAGTIRERLKEAATLFKQAKKTKLFAAEDIIEAESFLQWLADGHFLFLGFQAYDFTADGRITLQPGELGVFRMQEAEAKPRGLLGIPEAVWPLARQPKLVEITTSTRKSVVHRPVHMDYISVKRFDDAGEVIGEWRFLGLFPADVYLHSTTTIPLLRRKIRNVVDRAGFDPESFDGKTLIHILEELPRDELFQMDEDDLYTISLALLALQSHAGATRIFVRNDAYQRYVSCLIFIPRERFNTALRSKIQQIVAQAYNGEATAHYSKTTDAPHARVQLIIRTTPGHIPHVNLSALSAQIIEATSEWHDTLANHLITAFGEAEGEALEELFVAAFPPEYVSYYTPTQAAQDVPFLNRALRERTLQMNLYALPCGSTDRVGLKLFVPEAMDVPLSDILPMLENLGVKVLEERPFQIKTANSGTLHLHDFLLSPRGDMPALGKVKEGVEEALRHVWYGEAENDGFNRLVLLAGVPWREANALRAYAKYLKQIGFAYSPEAIADILSRQPQLAGMLARLFRERFQPGGKGEPKVRFKGVLVELEHALTTVTNVDEDRVIRRYAELMQATLRTNFYQTTPEGQAKAYLSFKFQCNLVPDLPLPKPYAEIFVYSPRFEGVHLRGGKVARGGLRWSDRREDFRTEVLGLMKAQMVKNAVIVPSGAKGGFVLKTTPADRDAFMSEGIACYQNFLRGLLDITDNVTAGSVIPPANTIRYDRDDPYLVVAADKGTATFSDIANGISAEYGHWLGDAFASGGSAGYDHKKMGITARGGWVSVVRHFREMGIDANSDPITVIGIGDMAGDVFGNGLLQSSSVKLVAAFNHLHIFIDPDPDPKKSFAERQRLFALPRSSWADYDAKLISKGGGIFERRAKTIAINSQMRERFGLKGEAITPDELIKSLLMAPVDLLWNGGIGTYAKASSETHAQVGDKANDAVRVNGKELRCRVIGEGGNLGFTQLGRIEYALNGGRVNTDAIDNSAGVDCSDHEVNIKIGLHAATESGKLTTSSREELLASMTDDVAYLVLRDNQLQTQAISVAQHQGVRLLDAQIRLMHALEKQNLLNRPLEYLPTDEQLDARRQQHTGLTRPELAVILAYSKLALQQELTPSDLADDPYLEHELLRYFPKAMQTGFRDDILGHQLRREIVLTATTNSIVNRMGSTFVHQMMEDTGLPACDITRAYIVVRDVFVLRDTWAAIEALDGKVPASTQFTMISSITTLVSAMTLWLLRNEPRPLSITETVGRLREPATALRSTLSALVLENEAGALEASKNQFIEAGVPPALAATVASLNHLQPTFDLLNVAQTSGQSLEVVGQTFFALRHKLALDWLSEAARQASGEAYWPRIAASALLSDSDAELRKLTLEAINTKGGLDAWWQQHAIGLKRYLALIEDLKTQPVIDLSMLVVALRRLGEARG